MGNDSAEGEISHKGVQLTFNVLDLLVGQFDVQSLDVGFQVLQ
jgi:hypothetical protein